MNVNVADIDVGMVLRMIEPEWKRAPETRGPVPRRMGEILGYAFGHGLRSPVQRDAAIAFADVPSL